MTLELGREKPRLSAFAELVRLVDKSRRTGRRMDLVTISQDHLKGTVHTYSPLGLGYSEKEVSDALAKVVEVLTSNNRPALENRIAEDEPSRIEVESHHITKRWKWKTSLTNLLLGVEIFTDDRRNEEWQRTWYVRPEINPLRKSAGNAIFALTHPIEATRAKIRQAYVAMEIELPPHTQTIEEFPALSAKDAAMAIRQARQK